MKCIIKVENLGKKYRIGKRESYGTLRDSIAGLMHKPFRIIGSVFKQGSNRDGIKEKTIWALKDVGFEIRPGEVVGIIGRNGAGKSTLFKILSRITDPTVGQADIYGRVASLLEVGTGFHQELTGRENIYLNGAILGMRRAEIERKFDEIVAFAEVEEFLDTPVKHYSSGMYVRLAFAVAAHLEPDILLVDEVLAVGDGEFQKKCIGKMEEVGSQGRTVLFVSHNMPMIQRLCTRAILLNNGSVVADGPSQEVIRSYLHSGVNSPAERTWPAIEEAPGDDVARLHAVRVLNSKGCVSEVVDIRERIAIEVEYWNLQSTKRPTVSIHLINEDGIRLFISNDFNNKEWWNTPRTPGLVRSVCHIPGNFLAEGQILVLAAVCTYNPDKVHAIELDAVSFQVIDKSDGDGVRGEYQGRWEGVVRPMLDWTISTIPDAISLERISRL